MVPERNIRTDGRTDTQICYISIACEYADARKNDKKIYLIPSLIPHINRVICGFWPVILAIDVKMCCRIQCRPILMVLYAEHD